MEPSCIFRIFVSIILKTWHFSIFSKKQDTPPSEEQARKQQQELSAGLEKTKTGLFSKLARVAGRSTIDAGVLDDLEELLISSDVGVETTVKIIRRIEERVARDKYMNASGCNLSCAGRSRR